MKHFAFLISAASALCSHATDLTGHIVDTDGKQIDFASVRILAPGDSSVVQSTVAIFIDGQPADIREVQLYVDFGKKISHDATSVDRNINSGILK